MSDQIKRPESIGQAWRKMIQMQKCIAELEAAGMPSGPINTIDQVFDDPQVKARGMAFEVDHPTLGALPMVANPIKMSATPPAPDLAPPTLGQHSAEVLGELLGASEHEIAQWVKTGVVQI